MTDHKCIQKESIDKNNERLYSLENNYSLLKQEKDLTMAQMGKDIKEIKDILKAMQSNFASKEELKSLEIRVDKNENNFDRSKTWLLIYAIGVIGAILLGLYQAFISKLFK